MAGVPSTTEWSLNGDQFVKEKLLGSIAFFSLSVDMDIRDSSRYMIWASSTYPQNFNINACHSV